MLWLWRFIFGYLNIKINQKNGEKILNCAAANNIIIWNLQYVNGNIYGNISARNFIKLYKVKKDIKCKIKIIKKCGIFFWSQKHKNRIGFIVGFLSFFLILFYFSGFVWIINVNGNSNIPTAQIIESCKKIGVYEGVKKNKINSKYAAQRLQLSQNNIAWCSFNVEGCVLTVNLSEIDVSNYNEAQIPTNIKSLIDGKIKKIDVTSGNVVVKVNDVVSKGDLLVSGIKENAFSTVFVHSSGEIIAETKRVFSSQGDFIQQTNESTGDIFKNYTVDFFGHKIPLFIGKINFEHNYSCDTQSIKVFNRKTPIKIACEKYEIVAETIKEYNCETLEEKLYNDIKKQLKKYNFLSIEELERECITTDKGMLLKITYICEENIAVQDEILISKVN